MFGIAFYIVCFFIFHLYFFEISKVIHIRPNELDYKTEYSWSCGVVSTARSNIISLREKMKKDTSYQYVISFNSVGNLSTRKTTVSFLVEDELVSSCHIFKSICATLDSSKIIRGSHL